MSRKGGIFLLAISAIVFGTMAALNNFLGKSARAKAVTYEVDQAKLDQYLRSDSIDFSGKDTYVINVWATRCKPCLEEIPELNRLQDKYSDNGIAFLAPTADEEITVRKFIRRRNDPQEKELIQAQKEKIEAEGGAVAFTLEIMEALETEGDFHYDYIHLYGQDRFIPYLYSINPADDLRIPIATTGVDEDQSRGIPLNIIVHRGTILFYEVGYDSANIVKMDNILAGLSQ